MASLASIEKSEARALTKMSRDVDTLYNGLETAYLDCGWTVGEIGKFFQVSPARAKLMLGELNKTVNKSGRRRPRPCPIKLDHGFDKY